jgi:tetratricopeptide (TPR) repeat protein
MSAASGYTVRDIESMLGVSRSVIQGLIDAGFVSPARGKRREYRFTFQDVIILRTAQGLSAAKIPVRKIVRSLKCLREALPGELPLTGLRIAALGNDIVVREGGAQWQADSGQLILDFEVAPGAGTVSVVNRGADLSERSAEYWFTLGCSLEEKDRAQAEAAYRAAIRTDPMYVDAYVNLGHLLHEAGSHEGAVKVYREGLKRAPTEATLHFNLAVVLEDSQQIAAALECYEAAIEQDQAFADAHYNAARLHQTLGHRKQAIRHFSEYRRLQS